MCPHTRSGGSRSASRSWGSQGPSLHNRAAKPIGEFELEGAGDGFDLDDLRFEVQTVDLRERRHYQALGDRIQRLERSVLRMLEREHGYPESAVAGRDPISLNSNGGGAGGSGIPWGEDEEDEEVEGKGKGKAKKRGRDRDTDME